MTTVLWDGWWLVATDGQRAARWDRAAIILGLLVAVVLAREAIAIAIRRQRARRQNRRPHGSDPR